MTLQEIKEEWADSKGWSSWENMRDHYEGDAIDTMIDTIAELYANECGKELTHLKELSDDAYVTLQKENERLKEKLTGFDSLLDTLNDQAKREFNQLTAERDKLKSENERLKVQLDHEYDKKIEYFEALQKPCDNCGC